MEIFLNNFLLISSLILLISVLLSKSSDRFGLPILVVFLLIGMFAGSEGFGGIQFENYELTNSLSVIALCLIIFSGGIDTNMKEVKENFTRGVLLSSLGIILTTLFVGFFVHFISGLAILESMLLGAILSATDAAAVFSAFKDKKSQVTSKIRNILKFESGSNDPMAYFLVTIILGFIDNGVDNVSAVVWQLLINPIVGVIVAWIMAKAFIRLNNYINLQHFGLYPALTLSFLFLSYSLSTKFDGNGFLTVYVFGILVGSKKLLHKTFLYSFFDGVSWIFQIGLFVMLGILVYPSRLLNITTSGLLIALFLMFIARPLAIFLCLIKSRFNFKEKVFISWTGLKGATPIVFASFAAVKMGKNAYVLFDIVFFVVLLSALIQGSTLKILAKKLGLLIEAIEDPHFPIDLEVLEKTKHGIKELQLTAKYYAINKRIIDLNLPAGSLVLFIKRDGSFVIPDGSTVLLENDKVLLVTKSRDDVHEAHQCFLYEQLSTDIEGLIAN